MVHYYGLDAPTGTLVHVDAQAQLVLGDDTTKNVRLPIERAYLASCSPGPLFPVPAPEFELAVLVVRLALKHGTWDAAVFGQARLRTAERRELEYLAARADPDRLREVVEAHLPQIGWGVWSRHHRALLDAEAFRTRLATGRAVVRGAAELMRRPPAVDTALRCAPAGGLGRPARRARSAQHQAPGGGRQRDRRRRWRRGGQVHPGERPRRVAERSLRRARRAHGQAPARPGEPGRQGRHPARSPAPGSSRTGCPTTRRRPSTGVATPATRGCSGSSSPPPTAGGSIGGSGVSPDRANWSSVTASRSTRSR